MEIKSVLLIVSAALAAFVSSPNPNSASETPETTQLTALYEPAPADDLIPFASYTPQVATCDCDGCLSEGDVRRIVKEEIKAFKTQFKTVASTVGSSGGGSNGGVVSSVAVMSPTVRTVQYRAVASPRVYTAPTTTQCFTDANGNVQCTTSQGTSYRRRGLFGWFRR